ncbi:uncharacterized protein G2W53_017059 [Senna tora]|uniref:Uncharacterized protein n=1 Tax=Senna tora TaxID=362788 RepID=A0A834TT08_9FABA|nr:uncharacterized protein G2W53_017059 [Senna tora]
MLSMDDCDQDEDDDEHSEKKDGYKFYKSDQRNTKARKNRSTRWRSDVEKITLNENQILKNLHAAKKKFIDSSKTSKRKRFQMEDLDENAGRQWNDLPRAGAEGHIEHIDFASYYGSFDPSGEIRGIGRGGTATLETTDVFLAVQKDVNEIVKIRKTIIVLF